MMKIKRIALNPNLERKGGGWFETVSLVSRFSVGTILIT
jgi:hypothetical protein